MSGIKETVLGLPSVRKRTESRERLDPSSVQVMLIGMQGEGGLSLPHEQIGLEIIAGKLIQDTGITPQMYDTQAELSGTGKVNTDKLAKSIKDFGNSSTRPDGKAVVGLSIPIRGWAYTESVMLKVAQDPPKNPITWVLGNAIPTYTDSQLIHYKFPEAVIVKGGGEDALTDIVRKVANGEDLPKVIGPTIPDLKDYARPYRAFTAETQELGGSLKIRTSEGCEFGACKFCSRHFLGGKDYRTVPEEKVVDEARDLLETFNATHFQLTDEDSFAGPLEATQRLISVWKSAELPRRLSFGASLRVETINMLHKAGLLDQLREIGLDQVFLGVEGGSDDYLKQIGKGQSIREVKEAVKHVKASIWRDEQTGEKKPLQMEMGFITFSYRMTKDMLVKNIKFLSEVEADETGQTQSNDVTKTYAQYVSSLFNLLEVRAGTQDANMVRSYVKKANDPRDRDHDKYQVYRDYKPDENFSINESTYNHVPFLDPEVGRIYQQAARFAQADESLYYAIKSLSRSEQADPKANDETNKFFLSLKELHLRFLLEAVGLNDIPETQEAEHGLKKRIINVFSSLRKKPRAGNQANIQNERRKLIESMADTFGIEPAGDSLDSVRREIKVFLGEETERRQAKGKQRGALAVVLDEEQRLLLVRPRNQETWGFPGGNINPRETPIQAVRREVQEELGTTIEFIEALPTITKKIHHDKTTGERPELQLDHMHVRITRPIDIHAADHEIVDTLYLHPRDILNNKVQTQENVRYIAKFLLPEADASRSEQVVFQQ